MEGVESEDIIVIFVRREGINVKAIVIARGRALIRTREPTHGSPLHAGRTGGDYTNRMHLATK